jgi:hypothetical protein
VTPLADALQRAAERLRPHRQELVEKWARALAGSEAEPEARSFCERGVDALLDRLSKGEAEEMLREEATEALAAAASSANLQEPARLLRSLERCCLLTLLTACPEPDALRDSLAALDELGGRRLEGLLRAHEQEAARRITEAQDHAARAGEKLVDLQRANEALRRSEAQSQHRAEQIGLLSSVVHRIAPLRDSDQLLQEAADTIQSRMSQTYVAVVVLDHEGIVVGRWAGRRGVDRRGDGAHAGAGGGRHRPRAAQARAPGGAGRGGRPRLPPGRGGHAIGDGGPHPGGRRCRRARSTFQSERPAAFDLDDVAVGRRSGGVPRGSPAQRPALSPRRAERSLGPD